MSLMEATGGNVRVSAHVPAVSGDKQNAIVRLGMHSDYVAPIWEGITIIPDLRYPGEAWPASYNRRDAFSPPSCYGRTRFHKQQTQHA